MAEDELTTDMMGDESEDEELQPDPIEEWVKKRITQDFKSSEEFMDTWHSWGREAVSAYYNAREYTDLRKNNKFPVPTIKKYTDKLVAHLADRLFFAGKPCTIVPGEETDKADADAKQSMMDWQDRQDDIQGTYEQALKDAALYGACVAQVDYCEEYKSVQQLEEVEVEAPDLQSRIYQMMGIMPKQTTQEWTRKQVLKYKGPRVSRIDPENLFVHPDKLKYGDGKAVMTRTWQDREFFDSKPYFFNQKQIRNPEQEEDGMAPFIDQDPGKREMLGLSTSAGATRKNYEYIEWQAKINAGRLDEEREGELVQVIVGLVNRQTVVRLDEDVLKNDAETVIVGSMLPEGGEYVGAAPMFFAMPGHRAGQRMMDIYIENLKQSVNRMWVMNKNALVNEKPLVNKAGEIILTNIDVDKAVKALDQPRLSTDIYAGLEFFNQIIQDATGVQDIITGQGEKAADTLGEANLMASNAELSMKMMLRNVERTFVEPVSVVRNDINCNFLDAPYAYAIVGDAAQNWQEIDPTQIRSRVDFMCESSTRETNKAVIGQQLMQLAKVSPLAASMGQPIRIDHEIKKLVESVFSWKQEDVHNLLPLIEFEAQQGMSINPMLAQMAIQQMAMAAGMGMPPPGQPGPGQQPGGGPPGPGPMPNPSSEQEAQLSAQAASQPQTEEQI